MDIGEATIEESQTEDKDWINNWKQFFHQFYVDDILIVPSWEEVKEEDKDKMILHIDPGTAFGTGMHETTQLVYPSAKEIRKTGHRTSRCRNRKRNLRNYSPQTRRRSCGRN